MRVGQVDGIRGGYDWPDQYILITKTSANIYADTNMLQCPPPVNFVRRTQTATR